MGTEVLQKEFRRCKRKGQKMDPKWLGSSIITHDFGKGFYSIMTLDEKKIVTKRISGTHLKFYKHAPSSPHQSTSPACPHQSTSPSTPHQSTSPSTPHQSTSPSTPHQSTSPSCHGQEHNIAPQLLYKCVFLNR